MRRKNRHAVALGRKGGQVRSAAKAAAVRANGAKGGRPDQRAREHQTRMAGLEADIVETTRKADSLGEGPDGYLRSGIDNIRELMRLEREDFAEYLRKKEAQKERRIANAARRAARRSSNGEGQWVAD